MLHVENLRKNFGPVRALDDISFSVGKGEIVGFLGPNGAGKTTAMRIIAGFLSADEGRVTLDGVDVTEEPVAVKAKVGYLPEQPPLYPELRIREYLAFVAGLKGVPKKEVDERIEEVMQAVKISERADQNIRSLSKGYKQRVGLAGALIHRPPILILDEPTVGLDPNQIVEIRHLISDLKADHRTLIISTHILAEVEQTCERVIIIHKGRIVAIDTKANLLSGAKDKNDIIIEVARESERAGKTIESLGASILRREGNRLTVSAQPEMREGLAKAVVESGCGLIAFENRRVALEDIFIKLTADAAADAN